MHSLECCHYFLAVKVETQHFIFCLMNNYVNRAMNMMEKNHRVYNVFDNKGPKGPHMVHLSTMCHLYCQVGQDGHVVFPIGPKNTNLVEDYVEMLLSVKFRQIPFSSFRGEVENVKS